MLVILYLEPGNVGRGVRQGFLHSGFHNKQTGVYCLNWECYTGHGAYYFNGLYTCSI